MSENDQSYCVWRYDDGLWVIIGSKRTASRDAHRVARELSFTYRNQMFTAMHEGPSEVHWIYLNGKSYKMQEN